MKARFAVKRSCEQGPVPTGPMLTIWSDTPYTSKDGKYVSITLGNNEGQIARSAVQHARKMLAMALLVRAHASGSFRTWVRLLVPSR